MRHGTEEAHGLGTQESAPRGAPRETARSGEEGSVERSSAPFNFAPNNSPPRSIFVLNGAELRSTFLHFVLNRAELRSTVIQCKRAEDALALQPVLSLKMLAPLRSRFLIISSCRQLAQSMRLQCCRP